MPSSSSSSIASLRHALHTTTTTTNKDDDDNNNNDDSTTTTTTTTTNNKNVIQMSRVEVNQRALIDKILARYASANAVYRELLQNSNDAEATHAELYFTTMTSSSSTSESLNTNNTTTTTTKSNHNNNNNNNKVTSVRYRNNGMDFRPQDWSRLQKIAEGNPDPQKVGAFGVGAYSMFSLCEEPMVISGHQALCFVWRGDALWTKVIQLSEKEQKEHQTKGWTTFSLPSRDVYPLPDMVEFGQFLCANLTFTQSLRSITVFHNEEPVMKITKTTVQEPALVTIGGGSSGTMKNDGNHVNSSSSSWWKRLNQNITGNNSSDVPQMSTPLFQLQPMYESHQQIMVWMASGGTSSITARYVSAKALTRIPSTLSKRMERVTKKSPPPSVTVQVLLGHDNDDDDEMTTTNNTTTTIMTVNDASKITSTFCPPDASNGRVFIGFRTSQTTGLAAHLAAPLIPTVEREAIDLQDVSLKEYNSQLLQLCGMVLRLTLEHAMMEIGMRYCASWPERAKLEERLLNEWREGKEAKKKKKTKSIENETSTKEETKDDTKNNNKKKSSTYDAPSSSRSLSSFATFMAKGVTKQISSAIQTVVTAAVGVGNAGDDGDNENYLNPPDLLPLSKEERQALLLMKSFCPQPSTPDHQVGTCLALGFTNVLPQRTPPCLTKTQGVVVADAKLPYLGMEAFIVVSSSTNNNNKKGRGGGSNNNNNNTTDIGIVRSLVYENAQEYHDVLCACPRLTFDDVLESLEHQVLERSQVIRLMKWWNQYSTRLSSSVSQQTDGLELKRVVTFYKEEEEDEEKKKKDGNDDNNNNRRTIDSFTNYQYYNTIPELSKMPLPFTVVPSDLITKSNKCLPVWFESLSMEVWASFMAQHDCMRHQALSSVDDTLRCQTLQLLHHEWQRRGRRSSSAEVKAQFGRSLQAYFSDIPCMPYDTPNATAVAAADKPGNLYVLSAELSAFTSLGGGGGGGSTAATTTDNTTTITTKQQQQSPTRHHHFQKVSRRLMNDYQITEEFLILLGCRQSVSMEFLFQNLDSLQWNHNPKPLLEYLQSQSSTLTKEDILKLQSTNYLPASNDTKRLFCPHELHVPSTNLPKDAVRILAWPEDEIEHMTPKIKRFLAMTLKCPTHPALVPLLQYASQMASLHEQQEQQQQQQNQKMMTTKTTTNGNNDASTKVMKCLDYIVSNLHPNNNGPYYKPYQTLVRNNKQVLLTLKFIPCRIQDNIFETTKQKKKNSTTTTMIRYYSPLSCFAQDGAAVMGFPVISLPKGTSNNTSSASYYATRFEIPQHPDPNNLVHQLITLVSQAQSMVLVPGSNDQQTNIVKAFDQVFGYLSQQNIPPSLLKQNLSGVSFIPTVQVQQQQQQLQWFRPEDVYFQKRTDTTNTTNDDKNTNNDDDDDNDAAVLSSLFPLVPYSPFLATVGVRAEPTTADLFRLVLQSPNQLWNRLGDDGYLALLKRIASNPPSQLMTRQALLTPFLLAYRVVVVEEEEKKTAANKNDDNAERMMTTVLAKASEITILDNSFFGRMFPRILRAPPYDATLEQYYESLGSSYISKSVQKSFQLFPPSVQPQTNTPLTKRIAARLKERQPLLLWNDYRNGNSNNNKRFKSNARQLLSNLIVQQVSQVQAVYSLQGQRTRQQRITACFMHHRQTNKNYLVLSTQVELDWFDIGHAVGSLLLQRCQLDDGLYFGSLLEAPLEQLRNRGFPVDRMILPKQQPKKPIQQPNQQKPSVVVDTVPPSAAASGPTVPSNQPPPLASGATGGAAAAGNAPGNNPSAAAAAKGMPISSSSGPPSSDAAPTIAQLPPPPPNKAAPPRPPQQQNNIGGGVEEILQQMFPEAAEAYIKERLGKNPNIDDVKALAEEMADKGYPHKPTQPNMTATSNNNDDGKMMNKANKKKSLGKRFGKALSGIGPKALSGMRPNNSNSTKDPYGMGHPIAVPASNNPSSDFDKHKPVSPAHDSASHQNMEQMLQQMVQQSTKVSSKGIHSQERIIHNDIPPPTNISEGGCEVIPGHNLIPYHQKTHHGITVFAARTDNDDSSGRGGQSLSMAFLQENFATVVNDFSTVLCHLCTIFQLNPSSVCIFHQATGGTIAFNSNKALHFNVRFYHALHYNNNNSKGRRNDSAAACYSYWFTTMAHELAHHFVSGHTKEHGFYTESYVTLYLPRLMEFLQTNKQ